jgi:hypothetical protein
MAEYPRIKEKNYGEQLPERNRGAACGEMYRKETLTTHKTLADETRLNNLSLQLKREIQEVKNESTNSYLRKLTKRERDGVFSMEGDGSWARNEEQKAELLGTNIQA